MPAGLKIDTALINQELKRRQAGLRSGARMKIENDRAQVISGLKNNIPRWEARLDCVDRK